MKHKSQNQGLFLVETARYTATDIQKAVNQAVIRERNQAAPRIEALEAYYELQIIIQRIDLTAVYANLSEVAQLLKGEDEELARAFVRLKGQATKFGYNIEQLYPDTTSRIHERIEGIQRAYRDRGESLRKTIAGMPGNMGTLAQFKLEKFTQGRQVSEETEYLYQQALYYKFKLRQSWSRAALLLMEDLDTKAESLRRGEVVAEYNAIAHNDLKAHSKPSEYLKNCYFNYKRAKSAR